MMRLFLLFALCVLTISELFGQSIDPQSVNCSGAKLSQATGSISFVVGDLVVLNQTDSLGNTLSNGFSAGSVLTTTSIKEINKGIMDVSVFPNPTAEMVNVQIHFSQIEFVILTITDNMGKTLYNGRYAGFSNLIGLNFKSYNSGTYSLIFENDQKEILGVYKIVKN